MFKCEICNTVTLPKTPSTRITIESRHKQYLFRQGAHRGAPWKEDRKDRLNSTNDNGGQGWEIGVSKLACPQCAQKLFSVTPAVIPAPVLSDDANTNVTEL